MATAELKPEEIELEERLVQYCQQYVTDQLVGRFDRIHSELAVGVNWSSHKASIVEVENRQYPKWPGYMWGTADLVCVNSDTLYIGDWKTGSTAGSEEQLLSLLAGFVEGFRGQGYPPPSTMLISCLEVTEEGICANEREVSKDELEAPWQAMVFQAERLGASYNPVPGIHCTVLYCPHLAHCKAIKEVINTAAELPEGKLFEVHMDRLFQLTDKPKSDDEASEIMARVSAANRSLKYLTACMKEYVKNGGEIVSGQWKWSEGPDGFRWRKTKSVQV